MKEEKLSSVLITKDAHKGISIIKATEGHRTFSETIMYILNNQKPKATK